MKHNFEENKERRLNAAKDRIESNEAAADEHFQAADKIASYIPMGQPILVGHHSERRHRKDLERINGSMSKGRSALEKAEYYRDRVKAMESNTAISSDDPNAIQKLTGKLDKLIEIQGFMKNANKCIRKKYKDDTISLDQYTVEGVFVINTPTFYMYNAPYRIYTYSQFKDVITGLYVDPVYNLTVETDDAISTYWVKYPYFAKRDIVYFDPGDEDEEVDKYGFPISKPPQ